MWFVQKSCILYQAVLYVVIPPKCQEKKHCFRALVTPAGRKMKANVVNRSSSAAEI